MSSVAKYILTFIGVVVLSYIVCIVTPFGTFAWSLLNHPIRNYSDYFMSILISGLFIWIPLHFLLLAFVPFYRNGANLVKDKNYKGKQIVKVQMVGTNQAFDTSFLSGITYNKTQYTVKVTYADGRTEIKKVDGKWLNNHSDLLDL